jgi:hypothetical protein
VRVPGKALKVVSRGLGTKIVKEQERIKKRDFNKTKGPAEMNPGSFSGWSAFKNPLDYPELAHGLSPVFGRFVFL